MVHEIKGKVVLVTGSASGIGAGTVRAFLQEGAKHAAILDIDEKTGKTFAAELNATYGAGKAKFFKCDVTDDDQLFNAFNVTLAEQGYIDVVVNNAGIMNESKRLYKKEIEINVTALVTGTLKAMEIMRKDKGGKGGTVINITSIAGMHQYHAVPIYYATKAAVIQFSNCIGMEENYKKTGVRVVTIGFGGTLTALISKEKQGTIDDEDLDHWMDLMAAFPKQKLESAVRGLLHSYKFGESGSTWLAQQDRTAVEITKDIKDAYHIMSTQMRA